MIFLKVLEFILFIVFIGLFIQLGLLRHEGISILNFESLYMIIIVFIVLLIVTFIRTRKEKVRKNVRNENRM